jgi:methyl-accepting chemotaxis protein
VKWFRDLKVFTKLCVSSAAVLLVLLVFGAFVSTRMRAIDAQSTRVTAEALPSIVNLSNMAARSQALRNAMLLYIHAGSAAETDARLKSTEAIAIELENARAEFARARQMDDAEHLLWEEYVSKINAYLDLRRKVIALVQADDRAGAAQLGGETVQRAFDASTEALSRLIAWHRARAEEITGQISVTIRHTNTVALAVAAIFLLFGAPLAWYMSRDVSVAMQGAQVMLARIARGELDEPVKTHRRDEVGEFMTALGVMQEQLRSHIQTERDVATVNARISAALGKASARLTVTNGAHEITYVNEAATRLFLERQQEIRARLPQFDAGRILGTRIESFWEDAAGQRAALATLRANQTFEIKLGRCTIQLLVNPILDAAGRTDGLVVEWLDRTEELQVEQEVNEVVRHALEGDLTHRLNTDGKSEFIETLSSGLNRLMGKMAEMIDGIRGVAGEVEHAAAEISAGNQNLSQRTEQQAASLEQTASSMEEMTSTVRNNADNAALANQLATAARDQAEAGGSVVGTAVSAMAEIHSSSARIANIISVIDEIAFQTNLLALNAAVEAARAGEQGRGFAVVAGEVRSLAGRSHVAAKEIKELIQDSVAKIDHGSTLVNQSGETLGQIVTAVKRVSDIVGEIASASREQSTGIEQVNHAVMQMDQVTQQNAALVQQATAASRSIADQARSLNEAIARYRTGPDRAKAHRRIDGNSSAERAERRRNIAA